MKRLLVCLLLAGVVGCGESEQVEKSEQAEKQQSGQSEEQDPRFRVNLPPGVRGDHPTQQPEGETPEKPAQETAAQATKRLVYKPLYRILTKQGLHIFTCSEEEVDTHVQLGNKMESVLGYVVQHEANDTIPLVKYLHPAHRKYWHYTTTQRPTAIPPSVELIQVGWTFRTPANGRVRIYHLRNLKTYEELFTDNGSEFELLVKSGWQDMQTEIYVVQRFSPLVRDEEQELKVTIKRWTMDSTHGQQPVKSITNTLGMKLNLIPNGTFLMGSPETEEGRYDNEEQHKVTITKAFYIQTTEVTQGQWTAVMGTEPWKGKGYVKEGPNYVASRVSWNDAVAYCKKLSEKKRKTYRLPTEAEWEYACRAGTQTAWSCGNDEKALGVHAWYDDENALYVAQYAYQVGLKKPNAFGLYDMHGNVWEWCSDYYEKDYYKQSPEKVRPGNSSRVLRGGSWGGNSRNNRSASRVWSFADQRPDGVGFRVVRELD